MNHYVSCEDCLYQEYCHQFDAFFGCTDGKNMKTKTMLDNDDQHIMEEMVNAKSKDN